MIKFGLIGHPIGHSASPALFAKAYGERWQYDLIEGENFEASWQRFLDEYQAINITAPFKEKAFRWVAECGVLGRTVAWVPGGSDSAGTSAEVIRSLGAINIAVKEADGKIHSYNSDYLGVMKVLRDHGFGAGSTVVVAGFGGAGRAAAAAARALCCDVVICNRTRRSPEIRPLEELPILAGVADLLIYTLPGPIPELEAIGAAAPGPGMPGQRAVIPDPVGHPGAILEANYRNPCLSEANLAAPPARSIPSPPGTLFRGYIPGTEWLRAQAETGYPLMTGCPVSII